MPAALSDTETTAAERRENHIKNSAKRGRFTQSVSVSVAVAVSVQGQSQYSLRTDSETGLKLKRKLI